MSAPFLVEMLAEQERSAFRSGVSALDRYFQAQVTQDVRRRVATCFVAIEATTGRVAGFYTMASASIPTLDLPESIGRKLPRYPSIPAVRVGRLAVDLLFRGKGLGGALLADALTRSLRAEAAAFALVVDAKDETAVAFYEHYGFERFASRPESLFLPLATAEKLVRAPRAGRSSGRND